jgi:DNA (cytosine-5)-methyltransferase 1
MYHSDANMTPKLTSLELCAGAGGQAIGLERAGFEHVGLVEIDRHCCATLRLNRRKWRDKVFEADLRSFDASSFAGKVDLLAAGLPCPPFSIAGKKLGSLDERNLFPAALDIVATVKPRAVMIENVRGILDAVFEDFRRQVKGQLESMGYHVEWRLLNASDFGVPQLRPRVIAVALRKDLWPAFSWPERSRKATPTVGAALYESMRTHGWRGAAAWKKQADEIAPTIVGGSKKHGGPDLGPTRARRAWASLGVNGAKIADASPARDYVGMPYLTVPMVALLQGFPEDWVFSGKKTAAYRQVGNAFPPPVAAAVARRIRRALASGTGQLSLLERIGVA